MIGKGKLRRAGRAALLVCALFLLILVLSAEGGGHTPGGVTAAEEKPYSISLLEKDVTVRENKTLFVTDVFHLNFGKEASVFTYRLPRDLDTLKEVNGRQYRTKSIAILSDAAVTVNGQRGSCGISLHSGDYLIAVAPREGKFSGEQVVSLSYLYDISLDRNGGFDDLTLSLVYGSFQPHELRVTVTFPKSIEGAELAFRNSAEGDEYQKTESVVTFRYSKTDARTEPVVMQVALDKDYFLYDSIFSKAGGWYYALFAVALACICAGAIPFILKRRAVKYAGNALSGVGTLHASELALMILGFLPVVLADIIYGVNARLIAVLPVLLGVFCAIGYFTSYVKWQGARTDEKQSKGSLFPSVVLFCLFFLMTCALLVFVTGAYVFRLDVLFVGLIAPVWATVTRVLLYPLLKRAPRGTCVQREKPDSRCFSDKAHNSRKRVRKAGRAAEKCGCPVDKGKLFAVGGLMMFTAVAAVFITVAIVQNQKLAGYVSGEGVVIRYEERLSEDSDGGKTLFYYPVVRYEYEGITYTETSGSGANQKTESVGETVEILINPLIPSEFSLKADLSVLWIILFIVSAGFYALLAMAVVVPLLDEKYPDYNWGGIFGSTLFIVFPLGLLFCVYVGVHAKGMADFAAKVPWAFAFLAFVLIGIFGICYEGIRALKLAAYKRTNQAKYERLCEKERKRFETADKVVRKLQSFGRGRANHRQEIQRLQKSEPQLSGTEGAEEAEQRSKEDESG